MTGIVDKSIYIVLFKFITASLPGQGFWLNGKLKTEISSEKKRMRKWHNYWQFQSMKINKTDTDNLIYFISESFCISKIS